MQVNINLNSNIVKIEELVKMKANLSEMISLVLKVTLNVMNSYRIVSFLISLLSCGCCLLRKNEAWVSGMAFIKIKMSAGKSNFLVSCH
jgi:hypothetical protein